jgi:Asp-tRNA(Asn)/Glu-tRNA(Gln) amidotransferase C subunit
MGYRGEIMSDFRTDYQEETEKFNRERREMIKRAAAHWAKIAALESTQDFKDKLTKNAEEIYNLMCDLVAEVSEIDTELHEPSNARELFAACRACESLIDKLRKED